MMPAVTQEEDSMLHRAERMLVQGRCKMTLAVAYA